MNFKSFITESNININSIEQIESNGNPGAIGKAGEHGVTQILNKAVWDEIVKDMNQRWTWKDHSLLHMPNRAVGNHKINVMIPRSLANNGIPDTPAARITMYNWGSGNFYKNYSKYKENWLAGVPDSTLAYINKYNKMNGLPLVARPVIQAKPQVYIVKPNDMLSKIALTYKKTLQDILKANPQITDPNKIRPGDKILIPA